MGLNTEKKYKFIVIEDHHLREMVLNSYRRT